MSSTESNSKDLIKKNFETREGIYRISDYIEGHQSRQQGYAAGKASQYQQNAGADLTQSTPVRITCSLAEFTNAVGEIEFSEHICFNYGKELHFTPISVSNKISNGNGTSSDSETTKMYKGTVPTCHDVVVPPHDVASQLAYSIRQKNEQNSAPNGATQGLTTSSSNPIGENSIPRYFVLVGFGAGQIQLFEASKPQSYVFFNESRSTDPSRVSSIKWVPHSQTKFLAAHFSGHIYLYDTSLPCDQQKPSFIQLKLPQFQSQLQGQSNVLSLFVNKSKGENPTHRLSLRTGSINHMAFSNCGSYLALACQDGFLRVFKFSSDACEAVELDLVAQVRSFFGGLTCVAWSPDGRYLATGGEDDLVTLISFAENRVVCRGRGHKSWITAVAFDSYACVCGNLPIVAISPNQSRNFSNQSTVSGGQTAKGPQVVYRLASVGQDTVMCLWELTEDVLLSSQQQLLAKQRLRSRSSLVVNGPLLAISSPSGPALNHSQQQRSQHPVKQSATADSNIVSIATSSSVHSNDVLSSDTQNRLLTISTDGRSPSHSTPSPASTSGSTSGSTFAGQIASKLAFWHRSDKTGHKSSKSSKKLKKRGSLSSATPAFTNLNGADDQQPQSGLFANSNHVETSSHPNVEVCSSLSSQAISEASNGVAGVLMAPASSGYSLLGTTACPRLNDVPVLEPLVLKKIAADPLSSVVFLRHCLLTACQAGYLAVWSRPAKTTSNKSQSDQPRPSGGLSYL